MAVLHLTKGNFDETIARGKSMVDFWTHWCGPCKTLDPVIEAIAESRGEAVRVCKVDYDAERELAGRFGVLTIPTVIIFEDGEEVTRSIGLRPQEALEALL